MRTICAIPIRQHVSSYWLRLCSLPLFHHQQRTGSADHLHPHRVFSSSSSSSSVVSFPPQQNNSFAWYGPDMNKRSKQWMLHLSPIHIQELSSAAKEWTSRGKSIHSLTYIQFPLPTLRPLLLSMKDELLHGRGFVLLRGFPSSQYSESMCSLIFYGIGCHLGSPRSQNASGHLLGHVIDLGKSSKDPTVRIYQTNERQTFHTDSCDVVGLLCLRSAQSGGLSLLVSSTTVFNEMLRTRPDLLQLLMQPMATDRRGEVPTGALPYFNIPVFTYHQQYLTCLYQRQYIDSAQRFPDAPRLTSQQKEALDLFDALADSPKLHFSMELQPGDMQFVYNHTLLHDRTAFIDWPGNKQKRHLLRLWLSIPGDRPLAPVFAERFGSVTIGDRGGIVVAETKLHVPESGT